MPQSREPEGPYPDKPTMSTTENFLGTDALLWAWMENDTVTEGRLARQAVQRAMDRGLSKEEAEMLYTQRVPGATIAQKDFWGDVFKHSGGSDGTQNHPSGSSQDVHGKRRGQGRLAQDADSAEERVRSLQRRIHDSEERLKRPRDTPGRKRLAEIEQENLDRFTKELETAVSEVETAVQLAEESFARYETALEEAKEAAAPLKGQIGSAVRFALKWKAEYFQNAEGVRDWRMAPRRGGERLYQEVLDNGEHLPGRGGLRKVWVNTPAGRLEVRSPKYKRNDKYKIKFYLNGGEWEEWVHEEKHQGPGPHPSGSDQDVHGNRDSSSRWKLPKARPFSMMSEDVTLGNDKIMAEADAWLEAHVPEGKTSLSNRENNDLAVLLEGLTYEGLNSYLRSRGIGSRSGFHTLEVEGGEASQITNLAARLVVLAKTYPVTASFISSVALRSNTAYSGSMQFGMFGSVPGIQLDFANDLFSDQLGAVATHEFAHAVAAVAEFRAEMDSGPMSEFRSLVGSLPGSSRQERFRMSKILGKLMYEKITHAESSPTARRIWLSELGKHGLDYLADNLKQLRKKTTGSLYGLTNPGEMFAEVFTNDSHSGQGYTFAGPAEGWTKMIQEYASLAEGGEWNEEGERVEKQDPEWVPLFEIKDPKKMLKDEPEKKHEGPGPHPSGSEQTVHGRRGKKPFPEGPGFRGERGAWARALYRAVEGNTGIKDKRLRDALATGELGKLLPAFEKWAADLKRENALVYTDEGEVIWWGWGTKTSVEFEDSVIREIKSRTSRGDKIGLTHNHPRNRSLSIADMVVLVDWGLEEMRAVVRDGDATKVYVARVSGSDIDKFDMSNSYRGTESRVREEFGEAIRSKKMTPQEASIRHAHEVMSRLGSDYEDLGLEYEVVTL